MIEEIRKNIYRCEVPLPKSPLKWINNYVVVGDQRTLVVDTAFNNPDCFDAFMANMETLKVDLSKTDVVITHLHADHSGLIAELYARGATIYGPELDIEVFTRHMGSDAYYDRFLHFMTMFGMSNPTIAFFEKHPARRYTTSPEFEFTPVKEGDIFDLGEYQFQVISVPGHTPSMINLYDEKHKVYLSADHVLDTITPNISYWGPEYPVILETYFKSLMKIITIPVEVMLPAHRNVIEDHPRRIIELLDHHRFRLMEVEEILQQADREMTVLEVTQKMKWRIRAKSWEEFPDPQKAFATGEAMVHLEYLAAKDRIDLRIDDNGVYYFSRRDNRVSQDYPVVIRA
ncbi:MAG: MBL fold metallo-hydrolase [Eubacteriaceae bacterium]|nr:MBL fold metallo-hydrolase [Eubacteriaceae bacterium]